MIKEGALVDKSKNQDLIRILTFPDLKKAAPPEGSAAFLAYGLL
jgi:hypothetical protein